MPNGSTRDASGLTPRARAFCLEFAASGGKKKESAVAAGYGEAGARTRAYELLQLEAVQREIRNQVNKLIAGFSPLAVQALSRIVESAKSEAVRRSAASDLLDRSGFKLPDVVEIHDHRTAADVDNDLAELLGVAFDDDDVATH